MRNDNQIYKKLGKKIRKTRIDRGMTQESLAYDADINRAYMGYIERGERHASIATVNKIASTLKIDLYKLFIFK